MVTNEGNEIEKGSVRILLVCLMLASIFQVFLVVYGYLNKYFTDRERERTHGVYKNYTELMLANPVPVRSIYTVLQDAKNKDFYFICIKYPDGAGYKTDLYTNEDNLDISENDRENFAKQIEEEFNVSLEDGTLHSETVDVPDAVRIILRKFNDKMCNVYYNPQHTDNENYYPPYLYITVTNDIVGM